jgi:hypothetical protein
LLAYGAVNLLWYFTPYAFVGVEYLHGRHELVGGASGSADRVMMSLKMELN